MNTNESGRIGFMPALIVMFLAVLIMTAAMYIVHPIIQWKEINLAGKSYKINESCRVTVRSDGDGVVLHAIDNNWNGKLVEQTVTIGRNELGGALVENKYKVNKMTQIGNDLLGYEYDVFYSKCREDALRLPLEVRKAFLRKYDLVTN